MVYLLATIANDADYTPSLLYSLGAELRIEPASDDEVWGIGYYVDNRALIIRKPKELLGARTFYELSSTVHSRIVLASIERDSPGLEKSPPFRFRRWLFSSIGNMQPLGSLSDRIMDKLPDFVRSDVSDKGGAGLAFGMFLAELHRAGTLDDALVGGAPLAEALHRTADTIERLSSEANQPVTASYVATNGRYLLLSSRGVPMFWKEQRGLESLPDGPPDPALTDFKQIASALKRFRAIVVARSVEEAAPGWTAIEKGQLFYVDPNLKMTKV